MWSRSRAISTRSAGRDRVDSSLAAFSRLVEPVELGQSDESEPPRVVALIRLAGRMEEPLAAEPRLVGLTDQRGQFEPPEGQLELDLVSGRPGELQAFGQERRASDRGRRAAADRR